MCTARSPSTLASNVRRRIHTSWGVSGRARVAGSIVDQAEPYIRISASTGLSLLGFDPLDTARSNRKTSEDTMYHSHNNNLAPPPVQRCNTSLIRYNTPLLASAFLLLLHESSRPCVRHLITTCWVVYISRRTVQLDIETRSFRC